MAKDKIVVIYGSPTTGKTTLIGKLMNRNDVRKGDTLIFDTDNALVNFEHDGKLIKTVQEFNSLDTDFKKNFKKTLCKNVIREAISVMNESTLHREAVKRDVEDKGAVFGFDHRSAYPNKIIIFTNLPDMVYEAIRAGVRYFGFWRSKEYTKELLIARGSFCEEFDAKWLSSMRQPKFKCINLGRNKFIEIKGSLKKALA